MTTLAELRLKDRIDTDALDRVWATLAPVQLNELWGSWRGSELPTGHALSRVLKKSGWVGKRFVCRSMCSRWCVSATTARCSRTSSWGRASPACG